MFLQIQEDMFTATNETKIVCKWFVNSCSVICFIKCDDNVRIDLEILKLMFWVLVLCRSEWGRRHAQNPNYRLTSSNLLTKPNYSAIPFIESVTVFWKLNPYQNWLLLQVVLIVCYHLRVRHVTLTAFLFFSKEYTSNWKLLNS